VARLLFPNLPVRDLARSVSFWRELGFAFNERFSDVNAACLVLDHHTSVMLLTEGYFAGFTRKPVGDRSAAQVILALAVESRAEVDRIASAALEHGGGPSGAPQDDGMMYTRSFEDPDGHLWEVFHLDPPALDQPTVTSGASA
jgi:predicted lactoylglutathione lyase